MRKIYKNLCEWIDDTAQQAAELALKIHQCPELAFQEYNSSRLLVDTLEALGFKVQYGLGRLGTAFKAVKDCNGEGPTIGFLAEYDALPGIGHGCGHNLIGPASIYAAAALAQSMNAYGGRVVVIGTPAEETGGGKILLLEDGAFDDVDYVLMSHPSSINEVGRKSRAITGIHMEFFGKSAHSSAPELGINALKAVIAVFNGVDLISQSFPVGVNTNGIITHGGKADNIIPDYARCQFTVRAETMHDVELVVQRFQSLANAACEMTAATSTIEVEQIYAQRSPNLEMEARFKTHMESLGEIVSIADPEGRYGSSDIGNVSLKVPIIHTYFKIMDSPVNAHSAEFTEKAAQPRAMEGMVKASKALAMLGADLLADESFRNSVDEEFQRKRENQKNER